MKNIAKALKCAVLFCACAAALAAGTLAFAPDAAAQQRSASGGFSGGRRTVNPAGTGAAGADGQNAEALNIRFSIVSLSSDIRDVVFNQGGTRPTPLRVIPSSFKPAPTRYTGPSPLVLYKEKRDENGAITQVPIAEITPPASSGDFFVLLRRVQGAQERYQAMTVPDAFTRDGANKWLIVSFSDKRLAARFTPENGGKPVVLDILPRGRATVGFGTKETYVLGEVYQLITEKGKQAWRLGHSTRYEFTPGSAKTFIYYPNPNDPNHLQIKGLYSPKWVEEKPAGSGGSRRR